MDSNSPEDTSKSTESRQADERDSVRGNILSTDPAKAESATDTPAGAAISEGRRELPDAERARHENERRKTELGFFGKLIGGEGVSATHVAFTVVMASFVIILFLYVEAFWRNSWPQITGEVKALIGLIGSALSFIFGRASKSDRDS